MRESLGAEAEAFFASYESPRAYGLRRNPLKLAKEAFEALMPFDLSPVSWAGEGYYYKEEERPGRHPYHEMGLYYIQEPSAMSVAAVAAPKPGEIVLDLCAAPGGKSTQLAGAMAGRGLLVCNEIVPGRAKILS
jgi:16S rRNA C967 or C1407 C5-methylase (RsmB/RsmF family)